MMRTRESLRMVAHILITTSYWHMCSYKTTWLLFQKDFEKYEFTFEEVNEFISKTKGIIIQ